MSGNYLIEFSYLFASIFFIFGLKGLSHPKTARRGMNMAALGMLVAIVGTLLHHEIISYQLIIIGSLTVTGSLLAFVKLQELIRGAPVTYKGQNIINVSLFVIAAGIFIYLIYDPTQSALFYVMVVLSFLFGILLVLPIGSADMPVVMSLMNSYAGLASAATGFAIGNNVLIIAGTLDGFSGFILSILMCKAMNRSVTNV